MHRWVLATPAFLGVAVAQQPAPAPLGQLIEVGGYRVHIYCTGQGAPPVIVSGSGFSFDWTLVQTEVAKFTRICTYDTSGTAWSDPGPELNCSGRVGELHSLLRAANIEPPYIVTGLSAGALVARLYALRYPADIVGAVIVDHAFLDVGGDTSPASLPGLDSPPVLIYKEPITLTAEETSDFRKLPESIQALHRWAISLNPKLTTVETAEDCLARLAAGDTLGRKPVAVVRTANDHPNYLKLQKQLLSLSTRSRQFLAERSFHSVEIDQPDVVVAATRWVFEAIREP